MTDIDEMLSEAVELARALGDPLRRYAILGEGNISTRVDDATFLVKASGTTMANATPTSLVQVRLAAVLALVADPPADGIASIEALQATVIPGATAARPSVETGMHAVLLDRTGARWVAHTHPTVITGLLSSAQAHALVDGVLFPDYVVVCGPHPLYLPYVDPGLALARALMEALDRHLDQYGVPPKAIYLGNHGFVAIGRTAAEVLAISDMAVKAATALTVALAAGGPRYLPQAEVERIAGRADEHYRQRVLGLTAE